MMGDQQELMLRRTAEGGKGSLSMGTEAHIA
jgi:hypothetical protein